MKKLFLLLFFLVLTAVFFAEASVYDTSRNKDTIAFYIKNYKKLWEKLPENEKYAVAFSSNLFELNHLYHLDFDARIKISDQAADPKTLLRDSWNIESYDQLIHTFKDLEEYGHSGAYKTLSDLLDKYPEKEPIELASDENLSIADASRLCFVKDTRELLGLHGIEAWDQGREITILRWGIASDYISSEEAMKLIDPVIKKIRQNYITFEDYICHYIMGRQFYALYDGNYEKLGQDSKEASFSARAYIPFEFIKFTSENADTKKPMTYSNCIYTPSEGSLKWKKVTSLYRLNASPEIIEELKKYEKEMPECQKLVFYWHISLLNHFGQYRELVDFTEQNMSYLERLPKYGDVYANSMYFYIQALNNLFSPQKALYVYNQQPELLQENVYYYDQFAYANYLLINFSSSQKEMDSYKQKAAAAFKLLKQNNYDIGKRLEGWLVFYEEKRVEEPEPFEAEDVTAADYSIKMLNYFDYLININQPDKVLELYQSLPEQLQADEKIYYDYGLANYLISYRCATIIEKDIYNSRAANIFKRLQSHGFLLDESINHWLQAIAD